MSSLRAAAAALLPAAAPPRAAAAPRAPPTARGAAVPPAAPPAAAPPAAAPLPPPLSRLASEVALCSVVLYKNANQHRRAPYFAAFRRLHALCRRVLAAARQGPPAGAAPLATRAAALALPLCAAVQRPQRGAGFAPLALTLAASAAVYAVCLREAALGL